MSQLNAPKSDRRPHAGGSEHYHEAMKKEHPDWNFCPTCNSSLHEVKKVEVFGIFLTHADNKFVISISLSPETGTGVVSPFSMGEVTRFPVWAEAMQLGSQGLSKERLFEETIIQHVIPAFRNGFKISRLNCSEEDQLLFTKTFMKFAQRDLAEKSLREINTNRDAVETKNKIDEGKSLIDARLGFPPPEQNDAGFKSPNMVSSGVLGFDKITNGGIPKRKITLISGPSGLGKTIFALQFLLEGAKRSEPGLLALADHRPLEVIEESESLGIGLLSAIRERKISLVVLDSKRTYEARGVRIISAKNRSEFLKIIEDVVTKSNVKRVVIDSLTSLISSAKSEEEEVRSKVIEATEMLDRLQTTVVTTGQLTTHSKSLTYFGVEENFVAGLIVLRTASISGKIVRYLVVPKMKGTDHNLHKFVYDIEPRTGLSVIGPLEHYISHSGQNSNDAIKDALQIANVLKSLALVNLNSNPDEAKPAIQSQQPQLRVREVVSDANPPAAPSGVAYAKPASKDPRPPPPAIKLDGKYTAKQVEKREIKQAKLTQAAYENPWSSVISSRNEADQTSL